MTLTLGELRDEDLSLLFEQGADPVAAHMAAFTAPDHMNRDAFERRWSRLRADETVLNRVIVVDDEVAGTIGSWGDSGEREVTYWIGRSYWGKGIATDALTAFLAPRAAVRTATLPAGQAAAVTVMPPRAFCLSVTLTSLASRASASATSSRMRTARVSQNAPSFR